MFVQVKCTDLVGTQLTLFNVAVGSGCKHPICICTFRHYYMAEVLRFFIGTRIDRLVD